MGQRVLRSLIAATAVGAVGLLLASGSAAGGGAGAFAVDQFGLPVGLPVTVDAVQTSSSFVASPGWSFQLQNNTGGDIADPTISVATGFDPSLLVSGPAGTPVTALPVIFAESSLAAGQELDGGLGSALVAPNGDPAIPVSFNPGCDWTRSVSPLQVPVGGGTQTVVVSVDCADPAVREVSVHFGVDLPGATLVSTSGPSNLDHGEQLFGPFGDVAHLDQGGLAWDLQALQTGTSYSFSATIEVPNPFGIAFTQKPGVTAFEVLPVSSPCSAGCGPISNVTIADPTLDGSSPHSGAVTFSVADATPSWTTQAERYHKFDLGGTASQPLLYTGPTTGTVGHEVTLETVVSGGVSETVTFTLGSQSCTVATGKQGAVCTLRLHQPPGEYTVTASAAGSVAAYPSSASSPFIIAAASPTQSPFTGTWQAIDVDGSLMTFTVSGAGSTVHVVLHDHYATGCVKQLGASGGNAILQGNGTIDGSTITFSMYSFRCENGISRPLDPGNSTQFFYDSTTDTMFSTLASWGQDTTWYRIGQPLEPPTTP